MIATLRGTVTSRELNLEKNSATVVIEVVGVGYEVTTTATTAERFQVGVVDASGESLLHIYHHITEADQRLFGFATAEEKAAFKGLISAHGVGPSLGLAVLGTHAVAQLATILETDDIDALCEVPGVGKKTAQRLLVELKSSLVLPVIDVTTQGGAGDIDLSDGIGNSNNGGLASTIADVREALISLGYSGAEVRTVMADVRTQATEEDATDSGRLLKLALQELGG